jgi:hypothetical protein
MYQMNAGINNYLDNLLRVANANVEQLNNSFASALDRERALLDNPDAFSEEQYKALINNIYFGNDNFLVKKPTVVPIDIREYRNPFRLLRKDEIKNASWSCFSQCQTLQNSVRHGTE